MIGADIKPTNSLQTNPLGSSILGFSFPHRDKLAKEQSYTSKILIKFLIKRRNKMKYIHSLFSFFFF